MELLCVEAQPLHEHRQSEWLEQTLTSVDVSNWTGDHSVSKVKALP